MTTVQIENMLIILVDWKRPPRSNDISCVRFLSENGKQNAISKRTRILKWYICLRILPQHKKVDTMMRLAKTTEPNN